MRFEKVFAYEDRSVFHTSNWSLDGVDTRSSGNCPEGRFWMKCSQGGDSVNVELYNDSGCDGGNLVAGGSFSSGPAWCELAEQNSSGVSGSVYFESFDSANTDAVEVVASLCTDSDLGVYYSNLSDLPVYAENSGMSDYCGLGSEEIFQKAAQLYSGQLGLLADFRLIANLDTIKAAVVHCALGHAFGACHESASQTMYSQLRDWHNKQMLSRIESWNLTFRSSGDNLDEPVYRKSANMIRVQRS